MKKIAIIVTNSNEKYVNGESYNKILYASYADDAMEWTDFCPSTDVNWMEYVRDVLFVDDTDVVVDFYLDMSYDMSIPTAMGLMAATQRWRGLINKLIVLEGCRLIDMTCLIK